MSEDQKREILELLENGKISAREAAEMLSNAPTKKRSAEWSADATGESAIEPTARRKAKRSMFRVRVRNMQTGENKVSVNIPVGIVKFGLKLGRRFSPDLESLDLDELSGLMSDMETGMLVEVQNDESNEHVQVFIE